MPSKEDPGIANMVNANANANAMANANANMENQIPEEAPIVTKEDLKEIDFNDLLSNNEIEDDNVSTQNNIAEMKAEPEHGATPQVIVEGDALDESVAGEPIVDTAQSYLNKLKQKIEEPIESVEVEGNDEISMKNKINSMDYSKYLKTLKKFFQI